MKDFSNLSHGRFVTARCLYKPALCAESGAEMSETMKINQERLVTTFEQLSKIGETAGGGINRPALSDADREARDMFCQWMRDAGMTVRVDDAGNYYGHRPGLCEELAPVVMGSHLDTVYNGGRFDGITGVQAALEVMRTLNDNRIQTRRPIELAVFTNEEGTRFEPSMLGSGVLAGVFQIEDVYKTKDRDGLQYGEELKRIGYCGKRENRLASAHAYFELHVEQGPVLEQKGLSIGVLEGIRGMIHLEITIHGVKDHAGPSPMEYRKDPMMGAAKIITRIEEIAYEVGHDTTTTVGKISCIPCCSNIIPQEVSFSVDIRNEEDARMNEAEEKIKKAIEEICQLSGLTFDFEEFWRVDAIQFPKELVALVEQKTKERGFSYQRMVSGAGHDASYISQFVPTAMLFVPSIGGLSHNEAEYSRYEDIARGTDILLDVVMEQAEVQD